MSQPDFKFRYRLDCAGRGAKTPSDAPLEMIRAQMRNLLDLVTLCDGNTEIKVDGFRLQGHGAQTYQLAEPDDDRRVPHKEAIEGSCGTRSTRGASFQNPVNVALYEPRIELIKRQLETMLPLVDLESNDAVTPVDAFQLKDLRQWVSASSCDPAEVFEHLGTRCNCDCLFCYNEGTPPTFALHRRPKSHQEELHEVETRLKYFDPIAKRSLFLTLGSTCEVLLHPSALAVLGHLRQKTDRVFRMPTNGVPLTPSVVDGLAALRPVYLDVSVNSSSSTRRSRIMRDKRAASAIRSLPLLKEAGIPYSVVIVPWPMESQQEMLADLSETTAYAAGHDVCMIQVSLPGYSRYFSTDQLFDRDQVWSALVCEVQRLRQLHQCPIVIMPGMYEENVSRRTKNLPEVLGTVAHSPAARAGLRSGDLIKRIAGIAIRNRPQARDVLSTLQHNGSGTVDLVVQRNGCQVQLLLEFDDFAYPYTKATGTHLGIIFLGTGLRTGYLEQLRNIIRERSAKNVLFLSSELVRPTFEQCLDECSLLGDVDLEVAVPKNSYLGGNICMGDLLVVDDFVSCIAEHIAARGKKPDLVVIPSSPFSLSDWRRDLTGRPFVDIERRSGVPVALLECETIYD